MNETSPKTEPLTEIQTKSIRKKFIYGLAIFFSNVSDFYKDIFINTHKEIAFLFIITGTITFIIGGHGLINEYFKIKKILSKVIFWIVYLLACVIGFSIIKGFYKDKSININLTFFKNILLNIYNSISLKINIDVPVWLVFILLIIWYLSYSYRKFLSKFIKEHILFLLIPYISFFSNKLGKKLMLLYQETVGDYFIRCYISRIKLLRIAFIVSSLYFLIIFIGIMFMILFVYNKNVIVKHWMIFLGSYVAGSTLLTLSRLHKYLSTSPTKYDTTSQNNIFLLFSLIAIILILFGILNI